MNGTFMFGGDRFGPGEDFYSTYRALGGARLSPIEVKRAVCACYDGMLRDCRTPERFDDFPSVADGLRCYAGVADADLEDLEAVVATHELGSVPAAYSDLLRRLACTHQLGLVSNIWARKSPWLEELARAGLADVFAVAVFSSDSRSVKPSLRVFRQALTAFPASSRVLFAGDSLRRDIAPAKALGLHTLWLCAGGSSPLADYVFPDLLGIEVA
jgi:HAD superfamily hydrolase (TIGR01549 family)